MRLRLRQRVDRRGRHAPPTWIWRPFAPWRSHAKHTYRGAWAAWCARPGARRQARSSPCPAHLDGSGPDARHPPHQRDHVLAAPSTETRPRFRAHDLRAAFVTIALATGKTETWVSDRTGHDGRTMIDRDRRKARTWNLGELGPLYKLVPELPGTARSARIAPRIAPQTQRTGGETGRRSGFRFRRRKA
jgi:hypothetical protein